MDKARGRSLSDKEIEDVLGKPPLTTMIRGIAFAVILPIFFFFLAMLGSGGFKGYNNGFGITINWSNGFVATIGWLGFLFFSLCLLFMPLVEIGNYLSARKWYGTMRRRLLSGDVYPDFYAPRKSLFVNFLLADKAKGRLYTACDYEDGLPLADLNELTCGFENKKDYMMLRFRSGDQPQKLIRTRSRDAAHQQIIRLQNFLGWN